MQTTKDKWTKKRKVLLKKVSGYAEPRYIACFDMLLSTMLQSAYHNIGPALTCFVVQTKTAAGKL